MVLKKACLPLLLGALVACSENGVEDAEVIDYASFDTAAVQLLIDNGDYNQALQIIREQEVLGVADKDDYLQATHIHLSVYDGIAAEVAIEKAREAGVEEFDTAISLAKAFLIQRKLAEAEAELEQHLFTGDDAFEVILLRGDIARELGRVEQARSFFNAAIDDKPDNFHGYLGLALLELNLGAYSEAESLAAEAAKYSTDDPIVLYAQGASAHYQLKFDEAVGYLLKAVEVHEKHTLARLELSAIYIDQNNFGSAREQLDKVYEQFPEHPMAKVYSALIFATEGEIEKAEALLLRVGNLIRTYPPAIRTYGLVAFRLGKATTAQPYLEQFLELVPEDRTVRLSLAESYSRRGMPDRSLDVLLPLLGDGSTDLEAHLQAAAAVGVKGEMVEAREWLAKAKSLMSEGDAADKKALRILERRLALARFATGDTERAAEQLRALYGEDNSDFTSLTLLANMQMQGGDVVGAEETTVRMLEVDPDKPVGHNLMGAIRFRQQRFDEALEHYNKALDANQEYLSALKNRGLAYLALRQYDKALPDFENVLERVPDDSDVYGMIGRTYLELERVKDALKFLRLAEDVSPRSPIVLADHAEALALDGYIASAINKANKAKKVAAGNEGLISYLNEKITEWTAVEEERKAEEAKEQEEIEAAVTKKLEEEAKAEAERLKAEAEKAAQEVAEQEAEEQKQEASPEEDPSDADAANEGEDKS